MAQHTIQLPLDKITYVDYFNPNTSYFGQVTVKLGGKSHGNSPSKYIHLRYKLPERKRIISYNGVYLYSIGAAGTDSIGYEYGLTVDWNNPTWNNQMDEGYMGQAYSQEIPTNAWVYIPPKSAKPYQVADYYHIALFVHTGWVDSKPDYIFNSNNASANRPYVSITYEDVPPSVPEPIDPIGDYKNGQNVIRFEWGYISSVGGVQKKYDLQWSIDQVAWTTISRMTANTYYDMPAGVLPVGNIFWRVQTYNEYDEPSGYSAVSAFYTVGPPAVPVIQSVSAGTARPTVVWTSSGQQIYELRVRQGSNVIYSTGIVPKSGDLSYKVRAFLPDGSYTAGVRIKNEYDIYSDWGESAFVVSTSKPGVLSIKVYGRPYGAKLIFDNPANYALVYRQAEGEGYICVGRVNAGQMEFDDYTAASGKIYMYFLRNVSTGETYTDSAVVQQIIKLTRTQLAPASDPANLYVLKFNLGTPPAKTETWSAQQSEMRFEGREYPVYEQNGFKGESLSCTFWLREYADVKAFYDRFAKGDTVLLRDSRGRKIYGALGDIQAAEAHPGYSLTFTVTRCDYNEEIEV
jgi:hypothetical protein